MTLIRLLNRVVLLNSLFFALITSLVSQAVIELLSSVGCRHHVQNCIVANISQLDDVNTKVIHQSLPILLRNISRAIHKPSVD